MQIAHFLLSCVPIRGSTDAEVINDIVRMREAGELRKVIAYELDVHGSLVGACTLHLPEEIPKRETQRVAILEGLARGDDVRTIATSARVPISRVVRLIRSQRLAAWAREEMQRRGRRALPVPEGQAPDTIRDDAPPTNCLASTS